MEGSKLPGPMTSVSRLPSSCFIVASSSPFDDVLRVS